MNVVRRVLRAGALSALLSAVLTTVGLVAAPDAAADTVMKATTAVNVRAGASTSTVILGVLWEGDTVTAVGPSTNGWTKVSYNGRTAYVYSLYLTPSGAAPSVVSAAAGTRTATTLAYVNVRTGPGLNYSIWTVFPTGKTFTVTTVEQNNYTQLPDGHWISSSWIKVSSTTTTTTANTLATTKSSSASLPAITGQVRATAALMIRTTSGSDFVNEGDVPSGTILNVTGVIENGVAQVIYNGSIRWVNANYIVPVAVAGPTSNAATTALSFALAQVGKAYAWGGNGPDAYDCSGLTTAAYKAAGISLPRTSSSQYGVGTPVTMSELRPGDLVFYYSDISHVAMYIGDGKIVHAANPSRGVVIDSVTLMPFEGGRRVA